MLSNAQISELLFQAAAEEPAAHRQQALRRAARSAVMRWPEEAADLAQQGRPLAELPAVGPWLARVILRLMEDPARDRPDPPELRRDFLTLAEARAILAEDPAWWPALRADLQMHSTWSDGRDTLLEMAAAAEGRGYQYVAMTDHSKGLKIARGMDEEALGRQGEEVAAVNGALHDQGMGLRVLHAIEMNLSPTGEGDMDPASLARLDLVLGAFHSHLRLTDDQTERYLRALRNPTVCVLAHPRGRRFDVRLGLPADWPRVFDEAASLGKAVEIDAHPDRQDLNLQLLAMARGAGCRISIGTDAHSVAEFEFMEFGLAAAVRSGIPAERILNLQPAEDVLAWSRAVRGLD